MNQLLQQPFFQVTLPIVVTLVVTIWLAITKRASCESRSAHRRSGGAGSGRRRRTRRFDGRAALASAVLHGLRWYQFGRDTPDPL